MAPGVPSRGGPSLSNAVMSMLNTSKCACVIKEFFLKLMFYEEINSDQENEIIKVKDMQLYEKLLLSYNLFNHKTAI